jgi:tetratricopeptide (TPR) repeat protein
MNARSSLRPPVLGSRRFRIESEVARGGMGVVHRAWDEARGRAVALKRAHVEGEPALRKRCAELLEREYRTLSALRHPRIIEVYDYGHDVDGPYYTMELLDGSDLRGLAPLPWQRTCALMRDIASSLALLHARDLVHRDVSPTNIYVTSSGAKLLDFGTLVPFGRVAQVAGTPSCVAPEALDGKALDQRVDLFSLGVSTYYALTRNVPYAARSLAELRAAWTAQRPAPPSSLAPDVPKALDELVLAMIELDPLSRPASAAEVIDRLSAIAELPRDEDELAARSYLRNPVLVGRDDARERCFSRLARMQSGRGGTLLIEGAIGQGKSALLAEVAREALVRGTLVLQTNGRAHSEPLGTARALAAQGKLEIGTDNGSQRAPSSLRPAHPLRPVDERDFDELEAFFQSLAQAHSLMLVVDDAHHADAESLSLLARIARSASGQRILIALSANDENARDQVGLRPLRPLAVRVRIGPLGAQDLEKLARSIFGDAPGITRAASWLSASAAGNPMLCMELIAQLIEERTIRYADGMWLLPQSFPTQARATALEAFERRIDRAGAQARTLAASLSARRTASDIELCRALAAQEPSLQGADVDAVLDALVRERVLVGDDGRYAFTHDALRSQAYERMDAAQRARAHLAIAEHLKALPKSDAQRNAEIGCQLVLAGRGDEGRRHFYSLLDVSQDLSQLSRAVPDLLAVDAHYERTGEGEIRRLGVMTPLLIASLYTDPTYYRFADRALDILEQASGIGLAKRLRRFIGALPALIVGLLFGRLRMRFAQPERRVPFSVLPLSYFSIGAQHNCQAILRYDKGVIDALVQRFAFTEGLPKTLSATLVHDGLISSAQTLLGRYELALPRLRAMQTNLEVVRDLPEASKEQWRLVNGFWEGRVRLLFLGERIDASIEALRASNVSFMWVLAECLRYAYHLNRGEMAAADQAQQALDRLTARYGNSWIADVMTAVELTPLHLAGDVVGLKRSIEQLETLVEKHPSLALHLSLARAMYEGHRKRPERAVAIYESIAAQIAPFTSAVWSNAQAHWAQCLNALGQHKAALERCTHALAQIGEAHEPFYVLYEQLRREAALAHSGLGEHLDAAEILDRMLARAAGVDSPLLVGLLHRDRAVIAAAAGDAATLDQHAAAATTLFRSTGNPALIAQTVKLGALRRTHGTSPDARAGIDALLSEDLSVVRSIEHGVVDLAGRAQRVLDHLVQLSGAERGRLYVVRHGGPRLLAQHGADTWSADLGHEVEEIVLATSMDMQTQATTPEDTLPATTRAATTLVEDMRLLPLRAPDSDAIVAVLALAGAARPLELTRTRQELFAKLLAQDAVMTAERTLMTAIEPVSAPGYDS